PDANRTDLEDPPPLPGEAGALRPLPATDPAAAALRPLCEAGLRAPARNADGGTLQDRVPAVDKLPHRVPGDRVREVILPRGVVRDVHAILPTLQDVRSDPPNEFEVHHSSLRFRMRIPRPSASSWIACRFRPPTPPPMRTACVFGSMPFRSFTVWTRTSWNPLGWSPRVGLGPRNPIDTTLMRYPRWRRSFDCPPWGFLHLRPSRWYRYHSWR